MPEALELGLEQHLALACLAAEDGAVVGQEGGGVAVGFPGCRETFDDVRGLDGDEGVSHHQQPGVVVEAVEDLDAAAVGELPVGAVGLPELVGELGLEADPGRARALVRLRRDQPLAREDAPDGCHRGCAAEFQTEVMGDRVRAGVMTASVSSARRRTIAAWISGATAWAHERGRRERGSRASYPPSRNLAISW